MSINQLKKCFLLTAIALLCAFGSNAQEAFEKGKLYHIYGAGEKENLVAEKMGETAGFLDYDKEDPSIYWKLSELSGSWRIINPVTNNALRVNGNTVEVGENNGSDEAQLWKFEDGMIIPANNPTLAIAKGKGGHSSTPKSNTPLARLSKFVADIEKDKPFKAEISGAVYAMLDQAAPYLGFPLRMVLGNMWLFKGLLTKVLPMVSPMQMPFPMFPCTPASLTWRTIQFPSTSWL